MSFDKVDTKLVEGSVQAILQALNNIQNTMNQGLVEISNDLRHIKEKYEADRSSKKD